MEIHEKFVRKSCTKKLQEKLHENLHEAMYFEEINNNNYKH